MVLLSLALVDGPTALTRDRPAEETAEWQRTVATARYVLATTDGGAALSRPKRGFESRWGHQVNFVDV